MIQIKMNRKMNCDLFGSCKKTKYASQVVAMGNAIGFTTFQGTESYRKAPIFITMNYLKEGGLDFPIDPCDTKPVDGKVRDFYVEDTCKCNSCDRACHYDIKTSFPVLKGFSFFTVGLFYLFVIFFTAIIYVSKLYYTRKNPKDHSRSSSVNTEYPDEINRDLGSNFNNTRNNINTTGLTVLN